jgi:glutamate synthase (ferredoxin)
VQRDALLITFAALIYKMTEERNKSLYRPEFEHDACGVGFVANSNGKREHRILDYALQSLCRLAHRGALDADAITGDGAGVLTQIPHDIFREEVTKLGVSLESDWELGIGFLFLPQNDETAARCIEIVEEVMAKFGVVKLGWREVPIDTSCLGEKALATLPTMKQVLVTRAEGWEEDEFERRLYLTRRVIEKHIAEEKIADSYVASFSSRQIVYKGLFDAPQLQKFYIDLQDDRYRTASAVYHQRYSTNTFPNWKLAHPFRTLAHNGEINTLLGNKNWTRARELELSSPVWGENIEHLKPVIQEGNSDSASLDNALELLSMSGRDILHSIMMLIPEAWEKMEEMPPKIKAFYKYHACLNEPWDGPAAVVFSDGRYVGAMLDRNGLRPARFKIYNDGLIVMGSEVGVVELDESQVKMKGRLAPGRMIAVDLQEGKLLRDSDIKAQISSLKPYDEWAERNIFSLAEHAQPFSENFEPVNLMDLNLQQIAFGWNGEQIREILNPMGKNGSEPIGSMGDDTPLAVLSRKPRLLYDYFKQLFAQVTNPPIDSIREKVVMSLATCMGWRRSWLTQTPDHAKLVRIESPFLLEYELEALLSIEDPAFETEQIYTHFDAKTGVAGMEAALESVCKAAENAVSGGKCLIVLSDRKTDEDNVPIPMLLAVGAVHHHLIRCGKRMRVSIVCESGEACSTHHFAALVGFGASSICPYVAIDTIRSGVESGVFGDSDVEKAVANFRSAIETGMLKIMAKMGISTISSYRGAQIFEAVGLSEEVMDRCFFGTSSQIGGISLKHIAEDAIERHQNAFATPEEAELREGGYYKVEKGGRGELHAFNPKVVGALNRFNRSQNVDDFKKYLAAADTHDPIAPRDLLQFKTDLTPVPLDEVESIESIRRRFTTAGMSLGALSPESHECLAIALNSIGGKSNSGEGGEDHERFKVGPDGLNRNSAIKQAASGRFGVTPAYLASATELEIKMAQGAKPGEGGQLPGHKVSPLIARLRHSVPGVPLISPPPHHDIYSIEDLAQLIYDLKQANPRAKVCVKLVSSAGVGTIAAGVAKAYADIVLISGHDGGTGASPLSSIKHAGNSFEIGLAETHQTLMRNNLRSRIIVRTDGGIKTGRDIVTAALLGAEEFNFGTAALIASGCAMFRVCHLNTCPVGVATQTDKLRLKFRGKPENVVAFFNGVAEDVRRHMAALGFRTIDEMVGRTDVLEARDEDTYPEDLRERIATLDLSPLLYQEPEGTRIHTQDRNDRTGDVCLDKQIIEDAAEALNGNGVANLNYDINNVMRNIGTRVSGEIGFRYGDIGLPEGSAINLKLRGSAGQSFACFLAKGVNIKLVGEANDYIGKGMNGGEIVIRPPDEVRFDWSSNIIIGNVCLFGATGGKLFAAGRAGERFCVRNSGATAVVEGAGDHGCEYMTGGRVVFLGSTGRNFGAGMSGGTAFVYDPMNFFPTRYNGAMVGIERVSDQDDAAWLKEIIQEHAEKTGSKLAEQIIADWTNTVKAFWQVVPHPPAAQPAHQPVHELEKEKPKQPPTGGF